MLDMNALNINQELLKIFAFWGSVLALKLLALMPLTAHYRFQKKVFISPEDAALGKGKVSNNDPDVERVRRAHLNDLENIPIWYIVTFLWLTTGPSPWLAAVLIRTFVSARIAHTISYVILSKQPHRAVSFIIGLGITLYQAVSTLLYYL